MLGAFNDSKDYSTYTPPVTNQETNNNTTQENISEQKSYTEVEKQTNRNTYSDNATNKNNLTIKKQNLDNNTSSNNSMDEFNEINSVHTSHYSNNNSDYGEFGSFVNDKTPQKTKDIVKYATKSPTNKQKYTPKSNIEKSQEWFFE